MKHKKSKLVLICNIGLVALLGISGAISTYAWFVTNRNASVSVQRISVTSKAASCSLKVFSGNYSGDDYTGYDPSSAYSSDDHTYASTFLDFKDDSYNMIFLPNVRYTIAFEISNVSDYRLTAGLSLESFSSPHSDSNYDYDMNAGIQLASGLSISTASYSSSSSSFNSDVESFVTSTTLTDSFKFLKNTGGVYSQRYAEDGTSGDYLNSAIALGGVYLDPAEKGVVLFSIAFSDETAFCYQLTEAPAQDAVTGKRYFKYGSGTQNVYAGMGFSLNRFLLKVS